MNLSPFELNGYELDWVYRGEVTQVVRVSPTQVAKFYRQATMYELENEFEIGRELEEEGYPVVKHQGLWVFDDPYLTAGLVNVAIGMEYFPGRNLGQITSDALKSEISEERDRIIEKIEGEGKYLAGYDSRFYNNVLWSQNLGIRLCDFRNWRKVKR